MTKSKLGYLGLALVLIAVFLFGFAAGKENKESVLSEKSVPTVSPNLELPTKPAIEDNKNLVIVTKVIDGDTINVGINGKTETLRLIGIDTPETVDPRKPVQCFGKEASNHAKQILSGKLVKLEADPTQGERDKYKRLLRYIFLENGENFNLRLIAEGFAHEYTYDLPYKYQFQFKEAEREAREQGLGLWNPNACDSSLNQAITPSPSGQSNDPGSLESSGVYDCNCGKLCGQIATCDEANYQLNTCGCSARDSDGDGVPCESLCR